MPSASSKSLVYLDKTATTDEIIEVLRRDGGVVIKNLESSALMQQIESELEDEFQAVGGGEKARGDNGGFGLSFPPESQRIHIIGKSKTADKLLMHPTVISTIDTLLSEEFPFYFGEPLYHAVSKPQLAAALAIKCNPGNPPQGLHRDDTFNHTEHPGPESQVTAIWASTNATKDNGATEVLLRSHLWDCEENPNNHRDEIVYAEMPAGSVLLIVGGLYHAGGRNSTENESRVLFTFFYNKGYLRQEENQYLSIPRDVVRSKPIPVQEMLGYTVSRPGAGYYNGGDPKAWLRNEGEDMSDLGTQFLY
jgi:ectoine hydroxylase-related dioxygenase (phytanoyl-CoA dioxygenase family)